HWPGGCRPAARRRPAGRAHPQERGALLIMPETARDPRLPPGQVLTRKWPVLHAGEVPVYADLDREWDFYVFGEVEQKRRFTWAEFSALPRVQVHADMHCVTRWSKLDNLWEGVPTRELLHHIPPKPT